MFVFLLVFAVTVAVVLLYYFLRMGNEKDIIITKLEHLNEASLDKISDETFKCELRHSGDNEDDLEVHPTGPSSEIKLGVVPYEFKGRILRFMNTKYLHYEASFNKEDKKITIDLIDEKLKSNKSD